MLIPLPELDDRRWSDLVEESRALIPVLAPEWTDHNASDPGITVIELYAWLAEMDVFRANRVTDAARRRFHQKLSAALSCRRRKRKRHCRQSPPKRHDRCCEWW